ncbi:MAG TPA: methyltransferase domain-containing protein [Verrucomicrobiae bacterium]|jgi:SAM-dependent methyltransferase|nr:methyltransferase domain-containing protein [Verrucomicrobiae bacterium]
MSGLPNESAQTEDFEFAALGEAKNYRAALLREFSKHLRGQVLEVGAGIGQITEALLKNSAISKLVSVEPDSKFCARLRAAFPAHQIVQGTIEDLKDGEPWNAILNVNVLEHIQEDERELAIYHEKLARKKGTLCLFVPARPEIYAPIDKDFGHFRRYTKPELRQKLEAAGFEILKLRHFNFAGYFAWWLNFCVLKKRGFDLQAVRFFDRIIFPAVHGFESRICPPPIGQSLLAIARAK